MRIPKGPVRALISCALGLLLSTGPGFGASGTAVGVDPSADAVAGGSPRQLVVGADVNIGETVVTGPEGKAELIFTDQTRLVVGPSSSLLLEDYLLRNDGSPGKFAVNALQGSFRFITGSSPKDDYSIRTATGTIGIRGTEFDFVVDTEKRETFLVLYDGAIEACNLRGECVTITNRCEIAKFGSAETAILGGEKRAEWQAKFPFANFPSSVSRQFRVEGAQACMHGDAVAPGGSITTPGSGGPAPGRVPDFGT